MIAPTAITVIKSLALLFKFTAPLTALDLFYHRRPFSSQHSLESGNTGPMGMTAWPAACRSLLHARADNRPVEYEGHSFMHSRVAEIAIEGRHRIVLNDFQVVDVALRA